MFLEKFGWFRGKVLEQKVDSLIRRKTGLVNTTFLQLHTITAKHLRITATCVTTKRCVVVRLVRGLEHNALRSIRTVRTYSTVQTCTVQHTRTVYSRNGWDATDVALCSVVTRGTIGAIYAPVIVLHAILFLTLLQCC